MSLGTLVFNRLAFDDYYNCSAYNFEQIPVEKRRNITHAVILVFMGALLESMYVPCVWALFRLIRESRHLPTCYPLMLYLGVVDCVELFNSTFVTAYLSMVGAVYCSHPIFIHISCTLAECGWFSGNSAVVILALNRCLVIIEPDLCNKFFKGPWKTFLWLLVPTLSTMVFLATVPPLFFSSLTTGWHFNPHIFYLPDKDLYHSTIHLSYNWFLVVWIVASYTVFLGSLFRKTCCSGNRQRVCDAIGQHERRSSTDARHVRHETKASAQVLLTCFFVFTTALGFIYSEHLGKLGFLVIVFYVLYQGSPAVIYLSMNKAIRSRILYAISRQSKRTVSIVGQSTVPTTTPVK